MTDSVVEELIVNKFLEINSVSATSKCCTYYNLYKDKPNEECLVSFLSFKPDYNEYPQFPDYEGINPDTGINWTEEEVSLSKIEIEKERAIIDSPLLKEFIIWFIKTYPALFGDNPDDDELFNAVKETKVNPKEIREYVDFFNNVDGIEEINLYPNVAFQNEPFERPTTDDGFNEAWYELYFIPSVPYVAELGTKAKSRWVGIVQVNICIPKTFGTKELNLRFDEIAMKFKSGTYIDGIRIIRTYRARSFDEDDFHSMPVTIEWRADLDR